MLSTCDELEELLRTRWKYAHGGQLMSMRPVLTPVTAIVMTPSRCSLHRASFTEDDPAAAGYVSFPSGLGDEYFQGLTAERRTPIKRNGFTVYRWTKDDRQDNEALDTLVQATAAAIKSGVYGMSDLSWAKLEAERGAPAAPTSKSTPAAAKANRPVISTAGGVPRHVLLARLLAR